LILMLVDSEAFQNSPHVTVATEPVLIFKNPYLSST
jgi:hypothetical protein